MKEIKDLSEEKELKDLPEEIHFLKIKDKVTKKEIKQLLKHGEKKVEKKENFLITLIKKFQFREYRKRNKKLIS
jgi:hypothetical protein